MLHKAAYPDSPETSTQIILKMEYLTDISILQNYTHLEVLCLWRNKIYDIKPLRSLKNMKKLLMGASMARDDPNFDFLVQMPKLEFLEVSSCGIHRVDFIAKYAPQLKTLILDCNCIRTFVALRKIVDMP